MADIRIKDLATTAASTASDDFVAVDGSANGTRKLNAYSPTFGGNVVATGTLTVNSTTDSTSKDTGAIITEGGLGVEKSATIGGSLTAGGLVTINPTSDLRTNALKISRFGGSEYAELSDFAGITVLTSKAAAPQFAFQGTTDGAGYTTYLGLTATTATLAGNLTVSGTGTSSFAGFVSLSANTAAANALNVSNAALTGTSMFGNVIARFATNAANADCTLQLTDATLRNYYIGLNNGNLNFGSAAGTSLMQLTTTGRLLLGTGGVDSGALLQVGTDTTTSAGGMIFGTDVRLFRSGTGVIRISSTANYSTEITNSGGTGAASIAFSNTGGSFLIGSDSSAGTALGGGTAYAGVITTATNVPLIFRTNSTTALTLDSSQNATFAGTVQLNSDSGLYIKQGNIARWTSTGLSSGTARADIYADSAGSFFIRTNGATQALQINSSQNATFAGSITTAAPTTGTAGAWKLGVKVDATTTLDTTKYLQVDIGGTLYKVALVTS